MNRPDLYDVNLPKGMPKIPVYNKPSSYEIAVSMFNKCNLRCKFCFQDHTQAIDVDFIRNIPQKAFEAAQKDIEAHKDTLQSVSLLFMGGELFSDDIPDSVLQEYLYVWKTFREIFAEKYPSLKLQFSVSTNGVWKKRERILGVLRDGDIDYVGISYDPVGRYPSEEVRQTVHETINAIHDAGFKTVVGFVTTKSSIKEVLNNSEFYVKHLNSDLVTVGDLNMYIGNPGWENDIPTDDDMFDFYKWCLDNHIWKINFIHQLMKNYIKRNSGQYLPKYCDCKYETCYGQTGATKNCAKTYSSLDQSHFYGKYTDEVNEDNVADVKAIIGIQKRGCLACEHMYYCVMPCWISTIFDGYKATNCPIARAFNYITDAHVTNFEKWEEING